jgi:probable rRNA maturation factor
MRTSRPRRPASEPARARAAGAARRGAPAAAKPSLSLSIQLGEGVGELPATRARLRRWAAAAIDADATLALRFVNEREARALNAQYRHRDYAPNVLTFPYHAAGERISADIVICMPVVRREARTQRKAPGDHLAHLVIHGVLHACGHDHQRAADAARMQAVETALLARFGIDDPWRR